MNHTSRLQQSFFPVLVLVFGLTGFANSQPRFGGVNLAGAEFGGNELPGEYNRHYTYPTRSEIDYYVGKGMNVFRLPFKWERLQYEANGPLNAAELSRIKTFVNYAASKEAAVILDPHNYARYYGDVIGSANLSVGAFEDFWAKLATEFKNNPQVIFGLMNEPHGMETELWLTDANAAISAIRATGANNLILVPGNAYTGAHSWMSNWYGTPNGTVMINIVDPADNYAFEVHQYFDDNSSGTSESCVNATIGSSRLKGFTSWARANNVRGFLGEFGCSSNDNCLAALDDMLSYMDTNSDVWLGWTYWAGGPWWGDYMFSVEPQNGTDKPQMDVLEKHLTETTQVGDKVNEINKFELLRNYPNPFNGSTFIEIELEHASDVELNIYNVSGQKIDCLISGSLSPGIYKFAWDGRAADGERLSSGIYFYALKYGEQNIAYRSMLLMQ